MAESNFHVKLTLRIDWSELDTFGHVNNISIFKYIQSARVEYLEQIGLNVMHQEHKIGPILASCKCEFRKPLFYPGQITIQSRVDFIKNTSFCICHQIMDEKDNITAEAQDIIVLFDFNKNKKTQLPQELRRVIENLENRIF